MHVIDGDPSLEVVLIHRENIWICNLVYGANWHRLPNLAPPPYPLTTDPHYLSSGSAICTLTKMLIIVGGSGVGWRIVDSNQSGVQYHRQ